MLMLDAYSPAQLQTVKAVLSQAADGTTVNEILNAIESYTSLLSPAAMADPPKKKNDTCPSCGQGRLVPVVNRDGLQIAGCPRCRYSYLQEKITR